MFNTTNTDAFRVFYHCASHQSGLNELLLAENEVMLLVKIARLQLLDIRQRYGILLRMANFTRHHASYNWRQLKSKILQVSEIGVGVIEAVNRWIYVFQTSSEKLYGLSNFRCAIKLDKMKGHI